MSDQLTGIESNSQTTNHSSSPIRHLPPELFHIVFDAARRDPPSTAPFTISHVCHSWRSFVLASPLLWTTVVVGSSPISQFKYYALWFQRSQNLQLSLYVHPINRGLAETNFLVFVYVLSSSKRSWKEIEFVGNLNYVGGRFHDATALLILNHIPTLRKLHVPLLKISPLFPQLGDKHFHSMHSLESLAIHSQFLALSPKLFSTCTHLRRIYLGYDDSSSVPRRLASLYEIIQHVSPQLEDLRIRICSEGNRSEYVGGSLVGPVYPLESPNGSISLPKLRTLDLSWGPDNTKGYFFSALLRKLGTPNLLSLQNFAVLILGEEPEFTPSPGLTHLELTGHILGKTAFPTKSIPAFFRTFSQLSNLRSVQFKFITWHNGEFAIAFLSTCPQLDHITLRACSSVREADLRRLIQGRKLSEEMACLRYLGVLDRKALELDHEAQTWFRVQLETFEYEVEIR